MNRVRVMSSVDPACCPPSTSTTSIASMLAKSATYGPTGCWRRNLEPSTWRSRSCRHKCRSASVMFRRRCLANVFFSPLLIAPIPTFPRRRGKETSCAHCPISTFPAMRTLRAPQREKEILQSPPPRTGRGILQSPPPQAGEGVEATSLVRRLTTLAGEGGKRCVGFTPPRALRWRNPGRLGSSPWSRRPLPVRRTCLRRCRSRRKQWRRRGPCACPSARTHRR